MFSPQIIGWINGIYNEDVPQSETPDAPLRIGLNFFSYRSLNAINNDFTIDSAI
jgi:hypothetical protein